ncbi:unnamed protein product [Amoebophrya sp. A25]|nr:unnamed protein product [Amoebophrya sp. A25]|eukprot:GSA25T00016715001.1
MQSDHCLWDAKLIECVQICTGKGMSEGSFWRWSLWRLRAVLVEVSVNGSDGVEHAAVTSSALVLPGARGSYVRSAPGRDDSFVDAVVKARDRASWAVVTSARWRYSCVTRDPLW